MAMQLTNQQKQYAAVGAVLIAVLGGVYVKFFWLPISQAKSEAKEKIEQVNAKIAKAKQQAARLKRLQDEIASLNQQAVEAEKRLPKTKSVPEILVTLTTLAQKSRVRVVSFTPGATRPQQYFIELTYPVSIKGRYHDIGRFLAAVALEERIFNVKDVNYPGGGDEMTVTFTLISYQYKG